MSGRPHAGSQPHPRHPVGVGKTFLATALGHAAIHARHSVHFERAGQLLKRLTAPRLDNRHDGRCVQPASVPDSA